MDLLQDFEGSDGSDNDYDMSLEKCMKTLQKSWVNEKMSPNLLDCEVEALTIGLDQIREMQENINKVKDADLKVSIHQLEVERIKFLLSSYLRCRLKKIQNNFGSIIRQHFEGNETKLTPSELKFAQRFSEDISEHITQSALKHLPNIVKSDFNLASVVPTPNLDKYVFVVVREPVEGLICDEETEDQVADVIDLEVGDKYLIRYKLVKRFIENSQIDLI